MTHVEKICNEIGRKELASALGVTKASIANAVAAGSFPARWFSVVQKICKAKKVPCPEVAFNFIEAPQEPAQ